MDLVGPLRRWHIPAIDFRPVLHGPLFGPLRTPALFNQVRLDTEVRTFVWPNGADFDPATLYDWPEAGPLPSAKAREWELAMTPVAAQTPEVLPQDRLTYSR